MLNDVVDMAAFGLVVNFVSGTAPHLCVTLAERAPAYGESHLFFPPTPARGASVRKSLRRAGACRPKPGPVSGASRAMVSSCRDLNSSVAPRRVLLGEVSVATVSRY